MRGNCPREEVVIFRFEVGVRRRIDAANLLFTCALHHAAAFHEDNYNPALQEFKRVIQTWLAQEQKMLLIFDGQT